MVYRGKVRINSQNRDNESERLFIGTLGVNCVKFTKNCLDSVQTSCKEVAFCYIDNGSNAENVELLKQMGHDNESITEYTVGFNGANLGVGPGWNQLVNHALKWGATKILICNNDITFGRFTIDGMLQGFREMKDEYPQTVMVTAANKHKNPAMLDTIKQEKKYEEHPDFSCMMIEPETIEKIGLFEVNYIPAFFEDNDYHWRILLSGYKAWKTDLAPYSHIASRTRYENPDIVTHMQFRENRLRFMQKMLTDTVNQKVADERYQHWIKKNPTIPHPKYDDVLKLCLEDGIIGQEMVNLISNYTYRTVPMEG